MFGGPHLKPVIESLLAEKKIPAHTKYRSGAIYRYGHKLNDLPKIGEQIGFFKNLSTPIALTVFTTKGGVLKSTIALNLARTLALHNLKTCVVGLDIQGDVTTALGFENDLDDSQDLQQIITKLNQTKGLSDFFNNKTRLEEIICPTDIETLFLIPETPELVALNDSLSNMNRREFWLKEKVVMPLKEHFDVVIMDCSPNWNRLTTNALVACDALISPLECKINNFRNFKVFGHFLSEFKEEMQLDFENIFIPTRYNFNRKLSMDILNWYQKNVVGHTKTGVRESVLGEEATALNKSFIELDPKKGPSQEIIKLMQEIFVRLEESFKRRNDKMKEFNHFKGHIPKLEKEDVFARS